MEQQLLETWNIHNRIHEFLLDAIDPGSFSDSLAGKGRTVFKLFAHIHNVRLMWLKSAAPDLLQGLEKLEGDSGTKAQLTSALDASGTAVEALLRRSIEQGGKVKGFKPHVVAFLGYLISHESHHRGQIGWASSPAGTHSIQRSRSVCGSGECAGAVLTSSCRCQPCAVSVVARGARVDFCDRPTGLARVFGPDHRAPIAVCGRRAGPPKDLAKIIDKARQRTVLSSSEGKYRVYPKSELARARL